VESGANDCDRATRSQDKHHWRFQIGNWDSSFGLGELEAFISSTNIAIIVSSSDDRFKSSQILEAEGLIL
jgi:hypothetical protein